MRFADTSDIPPHQIGMDARGFTPIGCIDMIGTGHSRSRETFPTEEAYFGTSCTKIREPVSQARCGARPRRSATPGAIVAAWDRVSCASNED
jgi:hypothetical protein